MAITQKLFNCARQVGLYRLASTRTISSTPSAYKETKKQKAKKEEPQKTTAQDQSQNQATSPDPKDGMVYKNPEFFEYDTYTFYDVHADMSAYRLPRPSSK